MLFTLKGRVEVKRDDLVKVIEEYFPNDKKANQLKMTEEDKFNDMEMNLAKVVSQKESEEIVAMYKSFVNTNSLDDTCNVIVS